MIEIRGLSSIYKFFKELWGDFQNFLRWNKGEAYLERCKAERCRYFDGMGFYPMDREDIDRIPSQIREFISSRPKKR